MALNARNYSPALMSGAEQTIKTALTGDLLKLETTDPGAVGPTFDLYHNSASPADSDVISRQQFYANNDAGTKVEFARIDVVANDVSAGTEDAVINFSVMMAGSLTQVMVFDSAGLTMDIDFAASVGETLYATATSAATSGDLIAVRGRAENEAAGASTVDARGVFGQGIAIAALNAGTVTGVQGEAIAKTTSTVVTVRGGFFAADSEGTPTSITNMYGTHTRVKTSVAPATDFIVSLMETEKFGAGVALDSFLRFKTTTWAGGETVATDVISTVGITGTVTNVFDYSGPTATSAFYSSATVTNFLEVSADSKGGAGATRGTPNQTATCDGSIVVKIGAKTLLVPLYNAVTIA